MNRPSVRAGEWKDDGDVVFAFSDAAASACLGWESLEVPETFTTAAAAAAAGRKEGRKEDSSRLLLLQFCFIKASNSSFSRKGIQPSAKGVELLDPKYGGRGSNHGQARPIQTQNDPIRD